MSRLSPEDVLLARAIGARIRAARQRLGLSRRELADLLEVDSTIWLLRLEFGRNLPRLPRLLNLAFHLRIPLIKLFAPPLRPAP